MKLLVISQHYWPESFRINEVVESLWDAGCHVSVLTGQPNYPDGKVLAGYKSWRAGPEQHGRTTIYRVPLIPRGSGRACQLVANYLSFLLAGCLLGPWVLRGRRFDAIFVYGTSPILQAIAGIVLKHVKNAKLVVWVQDLWPQSLEATGFVRNPRLLGAVARVVRWIYRRSDLLLVQSRAFVPSVQAMAGTTPVEYHPNPGELAFDAVEPAGVAPALALPAGFNVVFAGNLGTVQALDTIVEAASLLRDRPQIRFVLVGSGSRGDWVRAETARRGLTNVVLAGRFPPAAMPGIFAQSSALLLTLARSDILAQTVPSKLQAYLAAGRPVIACLDGEGARVVELAQAGMVCPAEDPVRLAAVVTAMQSSAPEQLDAMGRAARQYYREHYDPALLARRLLARLAALAGRPACAESL